MAKKLLSITLALLMVFTSAALLPAFAAGELIGDVDQDGSITSADARLALRGSVKLETLTVDFLNRADVDGNGKVESADARTILRASVKLDDITQADHEHKVEKWEAVTQDGGASAGCHCGVCTKCGRTIYGEHDFEVEVTKEYTCTEDGAGVETCVYCGLQGDTVEIPASHEWVPVEGSEKPATCTENGSCEYRCSRCNETKTEVLPAGHKVSDEASCTEPQKCIVCGEIFAPALGHIYPEGAAITVTKGIRCLRCGKVGLPSFNDLVNVLKDGTHSYTGFKYTSSTASEPKLTGIMETLINIMISMKQITREEVNQLLSTSIGSDSSYSALVKDRAITKNTYNLVGQDVVSALLETDPATVKTELVKGIDFLSSLPDKYTNEKNKEEDLTKIKNTVIGDVLKVTVTLAPERYSEVVKTSGGSAISRIDSEISGSMNSLMEGMQGMNLDAMGVEDTGGDDLGSILSNAMKMTMDGVSDITVTYYFDALTNAPIAAVYDGNMNVSFAMDLYITDDLEPSDKSTGSISIDSASHLLSYYFFDEYFNG